MRHTPTTLYELIKVQHSRRLARPNNSSIKINLYTPHELDAVASALAHLRLTKEFIPPDCFMLADSFLTTHLFRSSTQLTLEEAQIFIPVYLSMLHSLRIALDRTTLEGTYLIADMPDTSSLPNNHTKILAANMIRYGADAVKLEITNEEQCHLARQLVNENVPIIGHIGYTPQSAKNRAYGITLDEIKRLFALARSLRDSGCCALILERVHPLVNACLCSIRTGSLPIYSIFSGRCQYGGQSLNVWDSVYKPPFQARYFPSTADHSADTYPETYTAENICSHFSKLYSLTIANQHPLTPNIYLPDEASLLLSHTNPWEP